MLSPDRDQPLLKEAPIVPTREDLTKAVYLYKIALSNAVIKHGGEIRYLSQHSLLWGADAKGEFDGANNWLGVCAGLSLEWIKARKRGANLLDRLGQVKNEVMTKQPKRHKATRKLASLVRDTHLGQDDPGGELVGCVKQTGNPSYCNYPFKKLSGMLMPDCYHYISSGSHAMAAHYSNGSLDFYDPNVGEVKGTSPELLSDYLSAAINFTSPISGKSKHKSTMKVTTFS